LTWPSCSDYAGSRTLAIHPHRSTVLPRGDKSAYTGKQKRQAEHIEESERERGRSKEDAERIAWATVNKQDGGGKKSGSGRAKPH
jgi:hypothetical protein